MKTDLYLAAALIAVLLLGGLYLKGRHDGKAAAEKSYQTSLAQAAAAAAKKELADAADAANRESEHLEQVRQLEERVAALMQPQHPVIRLCQSAAGGGMPRTAATPAQSDAAAADAGHGVPDGSGAVSGGPDLSGALVHYAEDAEACRQQLIALQAWVRQTATP